MPPPNLGPTPPSSSDGIPFDDLLFDGFDGAPVYHSDDPSFDEQEDDVSSNFKPVASTTFETSHEPFLQDFKNPINQGFDQQAVQTESITEKPVDKTASKPTPPRSIFTDLESAYQSITQRNNPKIDENTPIKISKVPRPISLVLQKAREQGPVLPRFLRNQVDSAAPHQLNETKDQPSVHERLSLALNRLVSNGNNCTHQDPIDESDSDIPILSRGQVTPKAEEYDFKDLSSQYPHTFEDDDLSANDDVIDLGHFDSAAPDQAPMVREDVQAPKHLANTPHELGATEHDYENVDSDQSSEDFIDFYTAKNNGRESQSPKLNSVFRQTKENQRQQSGLTSADDTRDGSTIGEILDQYARTNDNSAAVSRVGSNNKLSPSKPNSDENSQIPHNLSRGLSKITQRIIGASSGKPPSYALPVDPSIDKLGRSKSALLAQSVTEPSPDHSGETMYGNTRDLLSTPYDVNVMKELKRASSTPPAPRYEGFLHVPNPRRSRRSNIFDVEAQIDDALPGLKHLSGMSFGSDLCGSIYMLRDSENEDEQQSNGIIDSVKTNRGRMMPAFQRTSVQPGYCRLSHSQQEMLSDDIRSPTPLPRLVKSTAPEPDPLAEPQDWETVTDSRATDWDGYSSDSVADYSTDDGSNPFNTFSEVHEASQKYDHDYRLRSPGMGGAPMLFPKYRYTGGNGFPNRNAMTNPMPALKSYKHPSPLESKHENPFQDPPPPVFSDKKIQQFGIATPSQKSESKTFGKLSILYEEHTGTITPPSSSDSKGSRKGVGLGIKFVNNLRKDDPRMASTPLSKGNSFAKFSAMGKKLNFTGTPNGTNMRYAGSSLVGSSPKEPESSPPLVFPKTPSMQLPISPPGTATLKHRSPRGSSSQSSPLSPLLDRDFELNDVHRRRALDLARQRSIDSDNFREDLIETSRKERIERAAVEGQTKLRELRLRGSESDSAYLRRTRLPVAPPMILHRKDSSHNVDTPLFKYPSYTCEPRLLSRFHSSSCGFESIMDRKTKISRMYLGLCFVFFPMLVLYGFGYLDNLMVWHTGGEIHHFSTHHKKIAKWSGIAIMTFLVSGITAFVIVTSLQPNDMSQ